ncbi:neutral/alkaline non-lysosomal ceramidase N-terminal domain-containing protein [bacterium]|nr:neutral/alkaline non-lysosomal ceramidase N-terminal domain-containing protein [bacterium]
MREKLLVGAAIKDITPERSLFLYGYPYVKRMSKGVHDPLYASALVLDNGKDAIVFCAADIIFITKEITAGVRKIVKDKIDVPVENIMISASHTHSGPMTKNVIFADPVIPPVDREFITDFINQIAKIIIEAYNNRIEAEIAVTMADGTGVGGNRIDKTGTVDPEVPVIAVRRADNKKLYVVSTVYCMHPTVIHEDSKLYSADFPGYTREYLSGKFGKEFIYLYQTGPEGNQSPRHFISGTNFDEAKRLGYLLGERIYNAIIGVEENRFKKNVKLKAMSSFIDLPKRDFMSVEDAEKSSREADEEYKRLKKEGADPREVRTVECARFGYNEAVTLTKAAHSGKLENVYREILPAEITVFLVDETVFVSLPGEIFVEYSLWIKEMSPKKAYVLCLTNGELEAYIITKEILKQGGYEAAISLFLSDAGEKLVDESIKLIESL